VASTAQELVQLLRGIEQRSRSHAMGLPMQEAPPQSWEGVIFSVLGRRMVMPLREVVEMLPFPPVVTRVPGARAWVRGIANIRGNLLPLIDLQSYLGGSPITPDRHSRVLVINHEEIFTGLLVERVMGMRHFLQERCSDLPQVEGALGDYVRMAFEQDGETWPVFSAYALAESPEFQFAAG
jgi:twitching motility protein PilI